MCSPLGQPRLKSTRLWVLLLVSPVIVFFFSDSLSAQQVILNISDESGEPVYPVIVTFYDQSDTLRIKEFISTDSARVTYQLTAAYRDLLVVVSSLGYKTRRRVVKAPKVDQTYELDFLLRVTPSALREVLVRATRKPYREQGDTVAYNVAAYSDGSERKIEEVIKKMPGITVNDRSGEIRYRGKPVQTVNLDGDNLFDKDYAIATRNLNTAAVKEVEAINNYNENPALTGLAADGEVALNLVLKDRVFDVSGSADLGGGPQAQSGLALDLGGTLLGIGKKIKSFSTIAHNSIGVSRSPYDPFSMDLSLSSEDREDFAAIQPIQFVNPISVMGQRRRTHRNRETFGSIAGLTKWSSKLTTRLRLTSLHDALQTNAFSKDDYLFGDATLTTSDATNAIVRPRVLSGNLRLLYDANPRSRLEYQLETTTTTTNDQTSILRNQTDGVETNLQTTDDKLSQTILWTKRLNDAKALELKVRHTEQTIRQQYAVTPSVVGGQVTDEQHVENAARSVRGQLSLIGRWKRIKYRQSIAWRSLYLRLNTQLTGEGNLIAQNDIAYVNHALALRGSAQFNWGKLRVSPVYELTHLDRILTNRGSGERLRRPNLLLRPRVNIRYGFDRNNFLRASYSYHPTSQLEDHLYAGDLLVNQRTIVQHEPDLSLRREQQFALNYFHNNLRKGYEIMLGGSFQINSGDFYPNLQIGSLLTRLRFVYAPLTNSTALGRWKTSKYLTKLKTTVLYNGQYSSTKYRNILEGMAFRRNTANLLTNKLTLQIAPKIPFNISQTISINYSRARSEGVFIAANTSMVNSTQLICTAIKEVFISLSLETIRPNLDNWSEQTTFLDSSVRYRPKGRSWDITARLMNLTDVREFRQRTVSDAAETVSSVRLLPRQIVFRLSHNF